MNGRPSFELFCRSFPKRSRGDSQIALQFESVWVPFCPMTSGLGEPQVKKWPFVMGDILLIGFAAWIFFTSDPQPTGWNLAVVVLCASVGVLVGVLPFLFEFREESRRFEAREFRSTVEQIQQLEKVGEVVTSATATWDDVQGQCEAIVKVAEDLAKRSQAETDRLQEITERADTRERDHLRLEVEKHRRGEREWLEVLVGILDHVFALHRAAVRSGQKKVVQQLEGFQGACLDICRRVGVNQYVVPTGEPFDPKLHKLLEGQSAEEGSVIGETLAPGYGYQGQPVRLPMVSAVSAAALAAAGEEEAKPKDPDLFDQVSEGDSKENSPS